MKCPEQLSAQEWGAKLANLKKHEAWQWLLDRHAERLSEVQAKVNDLNISPEETQQWKRALAELKSAGPLEHLNDLINSAKNAVKKQRT